MIFKVMWYYIHETTQNEVCLVWDILLWHVSKQMNQYLLLSIEFSMFQIIYKPKSGTGIKVYKKTSTYNITS